MIDDRTFDSAVLVINYAEGPPSGPPLMFLHGGGGRWQDFLPILPCLASTWHLFALDLRGHGRSGRTPEQYRPEHSIACPVLLLQGDPSHGDAISDSDVRYALSLLSNGLHVKLEDAGYDLGLGAWQAAPLLRAMTGFLESL